MDNVWFDPEGYQRTSKVIQQACLRRLLSFGSVCGRILDIGCGTGNLLSLIPEDDIEYYLGIDISPEMIGFARSRRRKAKMYFEVGDFLKWNRPKSDYFDTAVCAACLHWFAPNERMVIDKIAASLRVGGELFLSCAGNFEFFNGEREFHAETLDQIRKEHTPISPPIIFDDFRFDSKKLVGLLDGFDFKKTEKIEEKISFQSFDDFRDWHLGSGSVIHQQFGAEDRKKAVKTYYERLYHAYTSGAHEVSYSTVLLHLKKRG